MKRCEECGGTIWHAMNCSIVSRATTAVCNRCGTDRDLIFIDERTPDAETVCRKCLSDKVFVEWKPQPRAAR